MGGNMYLMTTSAILLGITLLCGSHEVAGFVVPKQTQRCHPSVQFQYQPQGASWSQRNEFWQRGMSADNEGKQLEENKLPFLLDPGTKGGALFLSLVAFIVPILFYEFVTIVFGVDGIEAGKWIGGGFTVFATVAWMSTYLFRVATKDMTYAKQLKDYENAVIAKRLEELDEDELQALVEEVERDEF